MANNKTGKTSLAQRAAQLIAGAQKRFPKGTTTVTVGGATTTVTAAVNEIQTFIDNRDAVVAAQATAKAKIAAEKAALSELTAFIHAFTATVRFLFGNDAEALADFGLAPHKGPKAKADIHGNITAQLVVTPADAANGTPAPAAPAPAPAATPSGGATASPAPTATTK